MFTGIIEELGRVESRTAHTGGARMVVASELVVSDAAAGDSIAVNGVCLTAVDITNGSFAADLSQETLDRSTLGGLRTGSRVNLERAVTPSTRLGGHIVQGHVDARGNFISAEKDGEFWTVRIGFPPQIARYLVHKGSVAVEGISLTIASLGDDHFDIAVIPKTWELTNLSTLKAGDAVNLEVDVIAKYVERMIGERR
jgi:riboflavin synthase